MRLLVFGDSIAVGAFDTENNGWVSLLAMYQYGRILKTKYSEGDSVVNLAVSGQMSSHVLNQIGDDIKTRAYAPGFEQDPFAVVIAIGSNDAALVDGKNQIALPEFSQNILNILRIVKSQAERIIVLGLPSVYETLSSPWCFDTTADWKNSELSKYDAELQRIAKEKDVLFIPMQDVLDRESDRHLPEGLHPNAEGHRLIYERVKEVLEKENIL